MSLRFQTKILESRQGRQQRIAKRFEPRTTFEFSCLAARDRFLPLQRELFEQLRNEIVVPFWPSTRSLLIAVPATATILSVDSVAHWMRPDAILCVTQDGQGEAAEIASVSGTQITLKTSLTRAWEVETTVVEGFKGYLNQTTQQGVQTSEVNTIPITFELTPGADLPRDVGPSLTTYNGTEVFDFPVNWSRTSQLSIEDPRSTLDFGYGRKSEFHPFKFPTLVRKADLLRKGYDSARQVEDFFRRHRGMQKEFYLPNSQRDLRAFAGIVSGGSTLAVVDPDNAAYLDGNTVHRAIAVKTPSGTIYNRIASATQQTDHTVLNLYDFWPASVDAENIGKISFLNVTHFASDAFNLEWRSDNVATTQVTFRTLEDFRSDP